MMRLIEKKYLEAYSEIIGKEIKNLIENFNFSEENGSFEYLTKSSAVYSSNIEGNSLDLNSYMNYELNKSKFKPDKEIEEIEDLIKAYEFAQNNELNERNFLNSHKLLSATILIKSKRGKYREEQIGVFSKSG
ncbi:MAG: Fic family protein, partial [Bacteroidales bacterium]|nr:Fic family protein [Bacteroidales bacterium]